MMRTINIALLIGFSLLFACDKKKATLKAIDGTWNIQKMYFFDPEGYKTITVPNGTIRFTNNSEISKNGSYTIALTYRVDTTVNHLNLNGNFYQINETDFIFTRESENDYKAVVHYYTKNDMQFQLPQLDNKGYNFILNR